MFFHTMRLLLCVAIYSALPSLACHAQQFGDSPFGREAVDPVAGGFLMRDQQFEPAQFDTVQNAGFFSACNRCKNPWFVRLGVGVLIFGESGIFQADEVVVPGASIRISDETTFVFDIGYQLSPHWTVTFTSGVPPKLDLDGTGPFEGVSYGTTRYAPAVLALQRHFFLNPCASIYVGGGVNYTMQYESVDGLIQDLDIENNAAVVLQLGAERRLNNRVSLFADAKKVFYKTESFGSFGGAAIRGDVTAYATVLFFGVRYGF